MERPSKNIKISESQEEEEEEEQTNIEPLTINDHPNLDQQLIDRIEKLKRDGKPLLNVCLICFSKDVVANHPNFKAHVCRLCSYKLREYMVNEGQASISRLCVVCADKYGEVCCKNSRCERRYCHSCLKMSGSKMKIINNRFLCILCLSKPIGKIVGCLIPFEDVLNKLDLTDNSNCYDYEIVQVPYSNSNETISVVSFFDIKKAALAALVDLNWEVNNYYTYGYQFESDQEFRTGQENSLVNIENVDDINLNVKFDSNNFNLVLLVDPRILLPISDITDEIPNTETYIYDFYRLLVSLNVPLYYIFQIPAKQNFEIITIISRFLQCSPIKMRMPFSDIQHQQTLVWTNIKTLNSKLYDREQADNTEMELCNDTPVPTPLFHYILTSLHIGERKQQ